MKIAFGNDHAAREVRAELIEYAKSLGHEVVDYGYAGDGSADYPVYARKVANAVVNGEADCGILVCGTGIGMVQRSLQRHHGPRAQRRQRHRRGRARGGHRGAQEHFPQLFGRALQ